jgi:type IV secretion system protein VirB2
MSINGCLRIFFAFLCLIFSSANNIHASTAARENAIEDTLCNVVNSLTGGVGKGVATIAIIALAIGLFLGKLSWGLAMATGVGVGLVFGAPTVVEWLSKDKAGNVVAGSERCN